MKKEIIYYCVQGDPNCQSPKCRCNTVRPLEKENKSMNVIEAAKILKKHNLWRRDNDNKYEMTTPELLGEAIDTIVKHFFQ